MLFSPCLTKKPEFEKNIKSLQNRGIKIKDFNKAGQLKSDSNTFKDKGKKILKARTFIFFSKALVEFVKQNKKVLAFQNLNFNKLGLFLFKTKTLFRKHIKSKSTIFVSPWLNLYRYEVPKVKKRLLLLVEVKRHGFLCPSPPYKGQGKQSRASIFP